MGRKLGVLKPARFPEIAEQERRLWERIGAVHGRIASHIWTVCRLPGDIKLAPQQPFEFTDEMLDALMRSAKWLNDCMVGENQTAAGFAQPSAAVATVSNPVHEGKAILPGELRAAFSTGIDRAVAITEADVRKLLGPPNERACQEMLKSGFDKLSDGARVKIGDVLDGQGKPGGSVRDLLNECMANGDNPHTVAVKLKQKFSDIKDYDWARLARTEIAFAQNNGMLEEYLAEDYAIPRMKDGSNIPLAPYHPSCLCAVTIDPDTGWILPDVAATACHICQSKKAEAITATRSGRV